METTQTSKIDDKYRWECQNDKHEWEWKDWSTSVIVRGYWVCKKCGKMKMETMGWHNGYSGTSITT